MLNIWHLAYQTPKTKLHQIFQISKLIGMEIQYTLKYEIVRTNMPEIFILILFTLSLSLSLSHSHTDLTTLTTMPRRRALCHPPCHATPLSLPYHPPCHATELAVPSTMPHHAVMPSEPPTIGSLSIGLQWWVLLLGLFDLGWVLRFVNVEGCGLVVAMVLWLWRQFGGCGGDYWVVMVVIFWVVLCVYVCFFIYFLFKGGVGGCGFVPVVAVDLLWV